MKKSFFWLVLFGVSACAVRKQAPLALQPFQYTSTKTVTATKGAVVSAHALASAVGVRLMQQGGNAVDAAIATQLALAVVYPGAGNLGGGGFMVARLADGKLLALDYRETAPAAASRDMYLDEKGNVISAKSINGHLSSGVPGTVAGLFASLQYAKLPFAKLVQPSIDLAENGFAVTAAEARALNSIQPDLQQYNTQPNAFAKGVQWQAGDTLRQPELARTLTSMRDSGAAGFYEGQTAQLLVAEMQRGHGLVTQEDLKNYKAKWREPHQFVYKGYTIVSMPMPSSGGVLLQQMLKMVEPKLTAADSFLAPRTVQLMAEAERRAFADRAEYMGDADFFNVPVDSLTTEAYLARRMADFIPGKAGNSQTTKPGLQKESEQTTHISIIDGDGNAVSVTTTLNNSFGSKTVVGGAGFFLNDEMDDFSAKPGVPNLYGAMGGEANAIAPGKRMLSSMTPTLVLQNNKPYLVVGTPGGTTIPTSVFQTILDIIDFGLTTSEAVNGPKFHHQWLPDELFLEADFPEGTQQALVEMGYKLAPRDAIGRTEVIRVLPNGRFEAVADNRGDDSAAGF